MPYLWMLGLFAVLVFATSGDFQKVRAAVESGSPGAALQQIVAEARSVIRQNDPAAESREKLEQGAPQAPR